MYKPGGGGGVVKRSKPASQGHPSRGGTTVGGGTKTKPTVYKSPTVSKPAVVRPEVTVGTGHAKPKSQRKSYPLSKDPIKYTRKQKKTVKSIRKVRKRIALDMLFPKLKDSKEYRKYKEENIFSHPTFLARNNFTSVSKEMWKKLGLEGKSPKLVYNDLPKTKNGAAYAYQGFNKVFIEPGTAERSNKNHGEYTTFAHEAAHTRQSPKTKNSEGLAEEFARVKGMQALRKMGVKGKFTYAPGYKRPSKKAHKKGRRYVTKGQFEKP